MRKTGLSISMRKDLVLSFINYGFVFLCGVVVYKLAAGFGPSGFGEYALARRAASFMQPVLLMGLGVGLVRYIAITSSDGIGDPDLQASYIATGYGAVIVFSLLVLAGVNMAPGFFAKLVFGKRGYEGHLLAISIMVEGYIVNALVFAYYRGRGDFVLANLMMALCQGLAPLAAVLLSGSVIDAVMLTGVVMTALSAMFALPVFKEVLPRLGRLHPGAIKELLRYGLTRVPGDLSLAVMLGLPAFLTAHFYGVKEAGYVAFGISLVSMVGALFGPVGFVMLPRLSSIVSEGRREEARFLLRRIIVFTVLVSATTTLVLYLFAGYLVTYWLGARFVDSTVIIRLSVLAAVPNAIFVSLRSSIDAAYVKAINARNMYKALVVSIIAYVAVREWKMDIMGIPASFLAGMVILCILTLRVSLSAYGLNLKLESVRARQ